MASIGKKILSAFVELTDAPATVNRPADTKHISTPDVPVTNPVLADNGKFRQYFEKLFEEANKPGPDYYEFSKMIEAMNSITDEKARYSAAFAGLQVQGLNRQQLLDTADGYLQLLDKDAANFLSTVDATVQEKVYGKRKEMEAQTQRIKELSGEISNLQQQIAVLNNEVKETEEKIAQSTGGYKASLQVIKSRIEQDMQKIKSFIQ